MSSKRKTHTILGMAVIALTMVLLPTAVLAGNLGRDECTVTSHLWQMTTTDARALTLKQALFRANLGAAHHDGACLKTIHLKPDGDTIALRRPINITWGGGTSQEFLIQGEAETESGIIRIDAYNFDGGDGEPCLVNIENGYVTLRNIEFTNVPAGMQAVCMNKTDTKMENVRITSGGTDGFVFGADSTNSYIDAKSGVKGVSGYGVVFQGIEADGLSNAFLQPTSEEMGATDDYGFWVPSDGADKFSISLPSVSKFFKNDTSKVKIITKKMLDIPDPTGLTRENVIWLRGWVVEDDGTDLCQKEATNLATRIQIYGHYAADDGTVHDGFYGYIAPWNTVRNDGLGTIASLKGYFSVYFKKGELNEVALVPEGAGGRMGQAKYLRIAQADGDCKDRELGSLPGGPGGSPTGGGGRAFQSLHDCQTNFGLYTFTGHRAPDPTVDSDGDGLFDDDEDVNLNCVCDPNETCWMLPDTDHDGIPDGTMMTGGREIMCQDATGSWKTGTAPDFTVLPCDDASVANRDTADPDHDNVPNALDKDSDNDGRKDYQEDRNVYYDDLLRSLPGYTSQGSLFTFGKGMEDLHPIKITDASGRLVEKTCELGADTNIGITYAYWFVKRNSSGEIIADPQRWGDVLPDMTETSREGYNLEILRCIHGALTSSSNFNGRYDGDNMETDMLNPYTDADSWCDGDGTVDPAGGTSMCTDRAHLSDNCPTVADETNLCKNMPCSPQILLYGVNPEYVDYSSLGERVPLALKKEGDNILAYYKTETDAEGNMHLVMGDDGKPQYRTWQEINNICFGDLDRDGIPNCVEAPNSFCGVDATTKLDPAKTDTDGDNFTDGWRGEDNSDVCPQGDDRGIGSPTDNFQEGRTTGYSCDPTKIYQTQHILSCFLDRDGDHLRDCDEDKNMDGQYNNKAGGVTGIAITESNNLSRDSDADGISDDKEVFGWGASADGRSIITNPSDQDTDGDHLYDGPAVAGVAMSEDRDGNGVITLSTVEHGANECPDAMRYDTDPTNPDTDGDGLPDGIEVQGNLIVGDPFIALIQTPDAFSSGGIDLVSDPTAADSDNDGLKDNEEYNGIVTYTDSNPCMTDSDGDGVSDKDDGCPLNPMYSDPALCGTDSYGVDSDADGEPDLQEHMLGTDPHEPDTDHDGLLDGEEDVDHDGVYEKSAHETDPLDADTDDDGLEDGFEVANATHDGYGTDPTNDDTDGDCIPDGLEDANQNGVFNPGSETNALSPDTDGDGLPDGQIGGIGEDLNCNGVRDRDAEGRWLETDPKLADSDFDGISDYDEMTSGGYFNPSANVGAATSGREGCMTLAGTNMAPTSMIYLFGLLLIVNRAASRCLRKRSK